MATVSKVRRLANPFKRRRRKNAKGRHGRRRLTRKQLKYFGTKAQRSAAKRRRSNPKRRRHIARRARRVRRSPNPALVVTLGANPTRRRRKGTMARRRRKANAHRRRRHTSRRRAVAVANPRRRRVYRRRSNAHRGRRRNYSRRRRNPSVFGARAFSGEGLKMVMGGLAGVAAAKFIPRVLPVGITSTLGNFGGLITTAASAFLAGWAADKFLGPSLGSAVLFGGLMQTGSVALNMIAPGFAVGGVPLALSGLGDLVPGSFVVPQNPLRIPAPPPQTQARLTMNGLNRAFGTAF